MRLAWLMEAAAVLISIEASGQTQPLPLSLKRAVEIAIAPDGSAKVALAQESIQQAQEKVVEARAALLPSLDTSVRDSRQTTNLRAFGINFNVPVPGFVFPSLTPPYSVFDARATAQLSVLNFSDHEKLKASKAQLSSVKLDLDSTKTQVGDEVAHDYLACLRADAVVTTASANVELSQTLLDLAKREQSAGTGTGIEITRADVQLANDRQRFIRAQNDRARAVLVLLKAMGLALSTDVDFQTKLESKAFDVPTIDALLQQARSQRPELKTQQQNEQVARLNLGAIRADNLPSIGAEADYGAIGADPASARGTYTMGVTLKVPIFDGLRRQARREEGFSQLKQEQIRTRDLGQQIELQVRLAAENLRSAKAEVDSAGDGLGLAENELAQARRRYEAGVATSLEVTDAQTRLQRARDNQIAALYDYNVARLDLATATGTIGDYINQ